MKKITLNLVLTLMLLSISTSYAQSSKSWEWAVNIVGTNSNNSYSLFTDKEGNSYVAGGFVDTLKVGNVQLISRGASDIYILKYNSKGNLIWAKQAGGTDDDKAYGIAADASGNLFLTGYFSGTADFSGKKLISNGDRDFFVAKYSTNGEAIWVKQGGSTLEDYGTAVASDKNGNVFITGIFKGTMSLGNSKYVSKGDKDIFIIKYNTNGEIVWSTTGGGSMLDESTAITTDKDGNCFVTGDFEGSAVFDKKLIVSAGQKDIFIAKYSASGNIEWLKRAGCSTGDDHASSIAADNGGNIYVTGYFSGIAYFGKIELKNIHSDDIFLVKYDANGNEIWAKQTGGKGKEHASALKLDDKDNIYVTGEFNADITIDANSINSYGDWDIFVIKYDNSGKMMGGTQIGGVGYDKAYCIGLDAQSNIYVVGYFSKAIMIGNTKLTSIDADDSFIAKLKAF
ncbi:MAG: SBBP repeat-containing protein [Bacteroidota bacterium]